jgi:hypothetical protein
MKKSKDSKDSKEHNFYNTNINNLSLSTTNKNVNKEKEIIDK